MNRIDLLCDALKGCEAALKKNPKVFPLQLAIDQIDYLIAIESGASSDLSKLKNLNIGWIAARELDGFPDTALIDKLHLISAEVGKIKQERAAQ